MAKNVHTTWLPAQSHCEALDARLADGMIMTELLTHVVCVAEECGQNLHEKPEWSRNLHWKSQHKTKFKQ